jgi:hypothetical protein
VQPSVFGAEMGGRAQSPPSSDDAMLPVPPSNGKDPTSDKVVQNLTDEYTESSMRIFDENLTDDDKEWTLRGRMQKWWGRWEAGFAEKKRTYDALDWLALALPCVGWLRKYSVCFLSCWAMIYCLCFSDYLIVQVVHFDYQVVRLLDDSS